MNTEAAGKENPGATVVPAVPRVRPVEVVLAVAVAAVAFANPDNDSMTGVAELAAAGIPSVTPALAGVANLSPPPTESSLVVVAAGVASTISPGLGVPPALPLLSPNTDEVENTAVVALPGVNACVGFTVAGSVVLSVPIVNPCDADPKPNPIV